MSSDFKNLFIGADNSKRTNPLKPINNVLTSQIYKGATSFKGDASVRDS
ncbi:hypothetical protein JT182_05780 [Helicobacter pylori]|nr:hypothetical protein [Helicobacter pylori]MCQ2980884.1 hypothetical protein [Helicobacter pylori]